MSKNRQLATLTLIGALAMGLFGFAPAASATDGPYFACAIGSGYLSSAMPTVSVRQGDTAVLTIDITRIGCDDALTFSLWGVTPPTTTVTFSDNPTTADSVTVTVPTSKTWPAITTVGPIGIQVAVETGHNYPGIYLDLQVDVTASDAPIAKTPTPALGYVTVGSSTMKVRTSWGAVDPNGIKSYLLQRQKNGGAWSTVSLSSKTQTSITQSLTFGATYRYRVRAVDKLGHTGAFAYGRPFRVKLVQQTSSAIKSDWHYTTIHASAASGGSLKYQPYSGSDFTYTFHAASVAWVSVKGPTRTNSSEVYVNGVTVKSNLSLRTSATHYRQVAYARNFGTNVTRSLRVFNLGQIGHSRLDIDAFVLLIFS